MDSGIKSWIEYGADCEFPIQNLPYGVFHLQGETPCQARPGVAIGNFVVDLKVLEAEGLFPSLKESSPVFGKASLNKFMSLGRASWVAVRKTLTALLSTEDTLQKNDALKAKSLFELSKVVNLIPAKIGDYTDFYSSKEHATNVGKLFRPDQAPLLPNWVWLPVGYHGRASSVVVSGTPIRRPWGQVKAPTATEPSFAKCGKLDFELEMAFFIGPGNKLGDPVSINDAENHIFGLSVMNDWSARDIQAWEYVPLGPFNGKNLGTTISPWIVTLEALAPFRAESPKQEPTPPAYLVPKENNNTFDIHLEVWVGTPSQQPQKVLTSNFKYLYWSMHQQLTHHTVGGCNLRPGDLLASGTITGPGEEEFGSFLEYSLNGKKPWKVGAEERSFINDGDTIVLKGFCQGAGYKIGFGDCAGTILPAHDSL